MFHKILIALKPCVEGYFNFMATEKEIEEEKQKRLAQQVADNVKANKIREQVRGRANFTLTKKMLYERLHDLDPIAKLLYLALRLHAKKDGHCWPPMRFLATKLDLDKNTIQKYIHVLEQRKWLRIETKQGTQGKRFEYWLLK